MIWILNLNCSIDDCWQLNVVRHCCLFELRSFADFRWVVKFDNRYSIFFFKIEVSWSYSFKWFLTFVLRISKTFAVVRLTEKNRCIHRIILLISCSQNIFKFNYYIFESNDWFCFIKNLNLIYVNTKQKSIKTAFYISHQWRNKNLKSVV